MNVQNNQPTSVGKNASEDELNAAKKILASLLLACQNLSLYPHGHTISKNSINLLHVQIIEFFNIKHPNDD